MVVVTVVVAMAVLVMVMITIVVMVVVVRMAMITWGWSKRGIPNPKKVINVRFCSGACFNNLMFHRHNQK